MQCTYHNIPYRSYRRNFVTWKTTSDCYIFGHTKRPSNYVIRPLSDWSSLKMQRTGSLNYCNLFANFNLSCSNTAHVKLIVQSSTTRQFFLWLLKKVLHIRVVAFAEPSLTPLMRRLIDESPSARPRLLSIHTSYLTYACLPGPHVAVRGRCSSVGDIYCFSACERALLVQNCRRQTSDRRGKRDLEATIIN